MIVLSNTTEQTLLAGQSITFDKVILHSGNGECHRRNTGSVKLRCNGIYEVEFSGNIGGTVAGPVQLSIQIGGETLPETTMISTAGAVGDLNTVATATRLRNCCGDYDRITVTNTGTSDVVVGANSALVVGRRS